MSAFVKLTLKAIITDELAIDLTWRGTASKPSFQQFSMYTLIRGKYIAFFELKNMSKYSISDTCHSKFPNSSRQDINKVCQQHILYARDRVKKGN